MRWTGSSWSARSTGSCLRIGRDGPATALLAVLLIVLPGLLPVHAGPPTAGWVERVAVADAAIVLAAKLDSGAEHSSLHAQGLTLTAIGGVSRVRFVLTDAAGRRVTLERPLVRQARIKRHGAAPQLRPVVRLTLCLGATQREVEVSLVDRGDFEYPLLLGRSFLRGVTLIDVDRQYLTEPACRR